jgi:predicted dehydrogenase
MSVMNGSMSRRDFLAASAAAGVLAASPATFAHSSVDEKIKVGLIGCGGRGTGAANDCATADSNVVIWAMADVFADKMEGSQKYLKDMLKERYQVTPDRAYMGFDAYNQVLASGVDYVILATPPCFRPAHFDAAIKAGKHVFFEKPIAVDVAGVKLVMAASEEAKKKGLGVAAGTQRRHDLGYRETMKRIHDGEIGEIHSLNAYWNQGGLWMNPRQPNWSDLEWQMRNWLYFTWLSGDHISEQHIHNIDVCNWAMQKHPIKATALGGRQVRTDPAYGHVFDHFAVEYEYDNQVKMHSYCRQQDGTAARVFEMIFGSKARSNGSGNIWGSVNWRYEGDRPNPYMLEHKHLLESIKEGKPINEGVQVAEATLTAIMGRAAAYSGQEVTWDQMMKLETDLVPKNLNWDMKLTVDAVPTPGKTPVF